MGCDLLLVAANFPVNRNVAEDYDGHKKGKAKITHRQQNVLVRYEKGYTCLHHYAYPSHSRQAEYTSFSNMACVSERVFNGQIPFHANQGKLTE